MRGGLQRCIFSLHLLSHFLLQETDRPTDVNGGPVSASQPRGVLSGQRGAPDGRCAAARPTTPGDRISSACFLSALVKLNVVVPSRRRCVGGSWSLREAPRVASFVVVPPAGPPRTRSPAHTLGLTVFPEVPCCRVTLCPSATTDRAFPCTDLQEAIFCTKIRFCWEGSESAEKLPGRCWC